MKITVGVGTADNPYRSWTPVVEIKATWSNSWQWAPDLIPENAVVQSYSRGPQELTLRRDYGALIGTDYPAGETRAPLDYRGYWVRVRLVPPSTGLVFGDVDPESGLEVWTGQIVSAVSVPDTGGTTASGVQHFVAVGPEKLLRLAHIAGAWYINARDSLQCVQLGLMPAFNKRDANGWLVGNRSAERATNSDTGRMAYVFGGTDLWTAKDILEYLIVWHMDVAGGPYWYGEGQYDVLAGIYPMLDVEPGQTVADVLDDLFDDRYGLDFVAVPVSPAAGYHGFGFEMFALLSQTAAWGDTSIPSNPRILNVALADWPGAVAKLEHSEAQLYDKFRIVGQRMRIAFSFGYDQDLSGAAAWSAALETLYKAGAGETLAVNAPKNDAYRADDKFRDVYQAFRLVDIPPALRCELDGTVSSDADPTFLPSQTQVRATLPELPMFEGYGYSTDPPTEPADPATGGPVQPDLLPLLVMAYHPTLARYIPVDQLSTADESLPSASVQPLEGEWGFRLRCSPNHIFAGSWSGANPTAHAPVIAYTYLVGTICIESDNRIQAGAELPEDQQSGSGREMVLYEPEAHLWMIAPETVLGSQTDGSLLKSPVTWVASRDDRAWLQTRLAGAIGRYLSERGSAVITVAELTPWGGSVGSIMEGLIGPGSYQLVRAPITAVRYDFMAMTTDVYTGQAR